MNDVGLLSARAALDIRLYIDDNDKLPIFYWATEKNTAEIEFIIQYNNKIIPIEVKSGKNVKSESLNVYRNEFAPACAVRASLKNYGVTEGLYAVPLYLIGGLAGILG